MKTQILLILFVIATVNLFAQNYTPVDKESKIEFKIKNFGFNTGGSFSGLKGKIHFEQSNLSASNFDVTIDANSINTDNNMRDNHLREDSYFDVKNHPVIHFVSEKVSPSNKSGTLFISGKLTIKKTTKDISFPFTAKETKDGYEFDGEFKINRKDYEVGGSSTLSDNVTITLHVVAKKE
jgi:polyisoprenoid-binding protein YceI